MTPQLTVHALDVALFPTLEREPGVYGIEPFLLKPGADTRIPAPKEALVLLLVSYTLLQADVPFGSRWVLGAVGTHDDGSERRASWHLAPPAPKHDNRRRATPDPDTSPTPGALDRGVFWVDLTTPLQQRAMRPGDKLSLQLAKARAELVLPAKR